MTLFDIDRLGHRSLDAAVASPLSRRTFRVRIAFDADNPGRWAFHCHNLYHMQTGMMTEVRYDGITV